QPLAGVRVYPNPADGRHRGDTVPRVRGDAVRRDPGLAGYFAHRHTDDVRAVAQAGGAARTTVPRERTRLRLDTWRVRSEPLLHVAPFGIYPCPGAIHYCPEHLFGDHHSEGLLSAAGRRSAPGRHSSRSRHFISNHANAPG